VGETEEERGEGGREVEGGTYQFQDFEKGGRLSKGWSKMHERK
jgi:hypothetical protein